MHKAQFIFWQQRHRLTFHRGKRLKVMSRGPEGTVHLFPNANLILENPQNIGDAKFAKLARENPRGKLRFVRQCDRAVSKVSFGPSGSAKTKSLASSRSYANPDKMERWMSIRFDGDSLRRHGWSFARDDLSNAMSREGDEETRWYVSSLFRYLLERRSLENPRIARVYGSLFLPLVITQLQKCIGFSCASSSTLCNWEALESRDLTWSSSRSENLLIHEIVNLQGNKKNLTYTEGKSGWFNSNSSYLSANHISGNFNRKWYQQRACKVVVVNIIVELNQENSRS